MPHAYGVDPDNLGAGTSQRWLCDLASGATSVLDVGCSTGGLSAAVAAAGSTRVVGIDIDHDAVAIAVNRGVNARVGDLATTPLVELVAGERFECIIFGDVLEHLVDPGRVLVEARELLLENGFVLMSVPNVAHSSVALALMCNQFEPRDTGLLDRTHLRFFTLDTAIDLAESAGFAVVRIERTFSELDDEGQAKVAALSGVLRQPQWLRRAAMASHESSTLQFVMRLEPLDGGAARDDALRAACMRSRVELRDAIRENAHLVSELIQLRESEQQALLARMEILRVRDHVIGLESELREARSAADQLRVALESRLALADQALVDIQSSLAWKIGRIATLPGRAIRKIIRLVVATT